MVKHAACRAVRLVTFQDSDAARSSRAENSDFNDIPSNESSQDEIPTAIPPAMAEQQPTYHPRDTLHSTGNAMLQTAAAGAIIAGVQNTLRKQNVGAMGIITRSGGIIALFGAQILNW